jgi:hypothetical protein
VWRGLRVLFQSAPTKLSVKLSVRHSSCVRLTIDTRITRKQHRNRCKTRTSAAGVRGKRHPHNTAREGVTVPSRFWVEIDRREAPGWLACTDAQMPQNALASCARARNPAAGNPEPPGRAAKPNWEVRLLGLASNGRRSFRPRACRPACRRRAPDSRSTARANRPAKGSRCLNIGCRGDVEGVRGELGDLRGARTGAPPKRMSCGDQSRTPAEIGRHLARSGP